jgi:hypothetical protein
MGLIACHYRAAEWRQKEIELTAHELLQYLDRKSASRGCAARLLNNPRDLSQTPVPNPGRLPRLPSVVSLGARR